MTPSEFLALEPMAIPEENLLAIALKAPEITSFLKAASTIGDFWTRLRTLHHFTTIVPHYKALLWHRLPAILIKLLDDGKCSFMDVQTLADIFILASDLEVRPNSATIDWVLEQYFAFSDSQKSRVSTMPELLFRASTAFYPASNALAPSIIEHRQAVGRYVQSHLNQMLAYTPRQLGSDMRMHVIHSTRQSYSPWCLAHQPESIAHVWRSAMTEEDWKAIMTPTTPWLLPSLEALPSSLLDQLFEMAPLDVLEPVVEATTPQWAATHLSSEKLAHLFATMPSLAKKWGMSVLAARSPKQAL